MITEAAFSRLLQLDESWEVVAAEYETEPAPGRFSIFVRETAALWPKQRCPVPTCGKGNIVCHDHADTRSWRHLDAFGKATQVVCAPPRGRCGSCGKVWRIPVPWEGEGKHFTKDFEAFALALMREMPMKRAGEILGEHDTRLWRMLFAHINAARRRLDLSEVVSLGVDEMSSRKGHHYLTVFADLVERRVIFATEGKDHTTFERFCEDLLARNGHPKAVTQVAIDMSAAYQKGVRENLARAKVVFDPFHVCALVSEAVDEVRRLEAKEGSPEVQAALKGSLYLFRKNPENLTPNQEAALSELDLKHMATGVAYTVRLELRDIYQNARDLEKAKYRLGNWVNWAKAKCERWAESLAPLAKAVATIERHMEGILAHWKAELSTAYMEGLNSVFSAVKRKARGYRCSEYMIAMLYFVAGKLELPSYPSH